MVQTSPAVSEFWRALNASANTQLQLQYLVDGVPQPLQVVALDGVPIGQGTSTIQSVQETSIVLPPGARAEFILLTPQAGQNAQLVTQGIDTGPFGYPTPARPLMNILAQAGTASAARLGSVKTAVRITRFASLTAAAPDGRRLLYFSETPGPNAQFYITVQGMTPAAYVMGAPPAITLHQGTTEDWTVENRTQEDHVFHIHQTRFQTLAINGAAVTDPALRDTITVPHWLGSGPYPSVTLRMDFRPANIVGTFVYHCHILAHEDLGMMAAIQLLPSGIATTTTIAASSTEATLSSPVTLTATITPQTAGAALTGTVQFFDNNVPLGQPVAVASGQAVLSTPFTAYGAHAVSAAYSGDATRNQSLSGDQTVTVEDFQLTASDLTVKQGQSGTTPVVMTASSGFASVVGFKCTVPSTQKDLTCTLNPQSLSGPGTITLSVSTTGASSAAIAGRTSAVLAAVCLLATPWRRRRRVALSAALVCGFIALVGCGGGSSSGSAGTPPGTYTLSVSGACGADAAPISHAVNVTVTVT